jgi:hypothetical protein
MYEKYAENLFCHSGGFLTISRPSSTTWTNRVKRRLPTGVLLLVVVLCSTGIALAQNSTIVGTVTDQTGAVIPGVTVTAVDQVTGEGRQTTTNSAGHYAIPQLDVGLYEVAAEQSGFTRQVIADQRLDVQTVVEVNFSLSVGEVTERVEVTASAVILQTADTQVSTVIENKMVSELPLNGRNFLQLQLLSAGVTVGKGSTFSAVKIDAQTTDIGGGFNVHGQRAIFNNFLLDGISFKDWIHGSNGMNPSIDAIAEFRTQTSNMSAEFGSDAGGTVNIATKAGTNQFHGSVYEFLRRDAFDANNFFTNAAGLEKDPLQRDQFGGTVGGPVAKDSSFFFFSYDGFREERRRTRFGTYPSEAMQRNYDFSELNQTIVDPLSGDPFPNNVIPESRVLRVFPDYIPEFIPLPNRPGLASNFVAPGSRDNEVDQFLGRYDHRFTQNFSLMGRYIINDINDAPPPINPKFPRTQRNRNQGVVLHGILTPSPTVVLDYRGGWNLFAQDVFKALGGTSPDIASEVMGIKGLAGDVRASDAPGFRATGFSSDMGGSHFGPRSWISERYEHHGSVFIVKGNHNIRFGVSAIDHYDTFPEIFIGKGTYHHDGRFSGHSFADMLLGHPSRYQLSPELFDSQFEYWEVMPWVQDDWSVTPNLSVNLGLRYERAGRPQSRNDTIANLRVPAHAGIATIEFAAPCKVDPNHTCGLSPLIPSSQAATRSTLNNDNNNFAPRIGLAYKLGDRTVLRTNYGIFYQRETINQNVFLGIMPPFVSFFDFTMTQGDFRNFDWFDPSAGRPPGGVQFTFQPEDYRDAYLQSWHFGIQRELGLGMLLDMSYVGNKATKLPARVLTNQPPPGPGSIDPRRRYTNVGLIAANESIANSTYNGLEVKLERRFAQGFSLLTTYTWAKALTDSQGAESGEFARAGRTPQIGPGLEGNKGLFNADARHSMRVGYLYELPFGKGTGASRAKNFVIRGWQIGGIATLQSGQPVGVRSSRDMANVGEGTRLPNRIRDANNGLKTVDKWFDTGAFEFPAQFSFGNAGVTPVTGPGIGIFDFSIFKNNYITEDVNFQFRAEFYNVLNNVILGDPSSTFGTAQFGQIRSTRLNSREIQFGFRLVF